jgi:transposase
MGHRFSLMSSKCSCRRCAKATSSSWTICAAGVREAIEAVGVELRYLPAYSPDLNPIELAFSKLKAALRKGAARTVDALLKLIGKLVKSFAPEECANYFRHAGYAI